MNFFWHNFLPDPIFISVGPLSIHWYGLILVAAILAGGFYAKSKLIKSVSLNQRQAEDLLFYLIIFGLIGARLGHVILFNFSYYIHHVADIVKVWQGGLSIQGTIIAGLITLFVWARKNKISLLKLADVLAPAVLLGQIIGRWGNYFNQELFGGPSEAWYSIPIAMVNRVEGFKQFTHFQPAFFYESFLNIILFVILYFIAKKFKTKNGLIFLLYLSGYSLVRFIMELIRIDQTVMLLSWRLPQLISLLAIILCLILIFSFYLKPLPKAKK